MKTEIIGRIIAGLIGLILIFLAVKLSKKAKRKLLSVIGISFLVFAVLSWIIPSGTYASGKLTTKAISPVGIIDFINAPLTAFITFALYGALFAIIGGFYGVVEKTGALNSVTNSLKNKFEGRENTLLIITIILFTVLSSVTGLVVPLFVLVPLFAIALQKLNFDKVTTLAATVGSLLLGNVTSTLGFNISGYTKNLLSIDMLNQIWAKVILLVLLTAIYTFILIISSKKDSKKSENTKQVSKNEDTKETKKKVAPKKTKTTKAKTTKKTTKSNTKGLAITKSVKKASDIKDVNALPFVIMITLMMIFAFVAMYNWYYSFEVDVFTKMHESLMKVKIFDFKIFENLLSGINQLGYWSNMEFAGLLVVNSMLIAFIYKLSLNEYIESFIEGMKKWIPTAIYTTLASIILTILYQALQSGSGTLVDTINGWLFGIADGFNPAVTTFATFVSSFFFNDLYYLLADMSTFVTGFEAAELSVAGLLIQAVYGTAMMIFPTSVVLIAGLSYFDVSYKKWIKFIWKFVLITLLLVLLVSGILTLL